MEDIEEYLSEVRSQIFRITKVRSVEKYTEQILTSNRANLRLRIRFSDGSLLEISEAVEFHEGKLRWLSYHYQNTSGHLIFRYDNTPHHPKLPNFPKHKHIPDGVIGYIHPSIQEVLTEVMEFIKSSER